MSDNVTCSSSLKSHSACRVNISLGNLMCRNARPRNQRPHSSQGSKYVNAIFRCLILLRGHFSLTLPVVSKLRNCSEFLSKNDKIIFLSTFAGASQSLKTNLNPVLRLHELMALFSRTCFRALQLVASSWKYFNISNISVFIVSIFKRFTQFYDYQTKLYAAPFSNSSRYLSKI